MTKKDYEKFATAIRQARHSEHDNVDGDSYNNGVTVTAHKIARVLQGDNPRFQVERFLEACGIPPEEWNL